MLFCSTLAQAYPGWNPDPNSSATTVVQDSFKELYGTDAKLVALHAGLEVSVQSILDFNQ